MPPRRRRWPALVSLIVSVVVAFGWIRSYLSMDMLEYRHGEVQSAATRPDGVAVTNFLAQRETAHHVRGIIYLSRRSYCSASIAAPENVRAPRGPAGWRISHLPLQNLGLLPVDTLYYTAPLEWKFGGFGVFSHNRNGEVSRAVCFPYWFMVLCSSAPLLHLTFTSIRRRRRERAGRCGACGYDLRGGQANAGDRRCSECGATVDGALAAATAQPIRIESPPPEQDATS